MSGLFDWYIGINTRLEFRILKHQFREVHVQNHIEIINGSPSLSLRSNAGNCSTINSVPEMKVAVELEVDLEIIIK
jgi:hypothetical protein